MNEQLFEKILQECPQRKIVSCARKLMKNSRLTSMAVSRTLCELGYWLYVYGYVDLALEVCGFSHLPFPKPGRINFNVWSFILNLWGLEAWILHEQGKEKKSEEVIDKIRELYSIPNGIFDTPEKMEAHNRVLFQELTLQDALNQKQVEEYESQKNRRMANEYRFTALFTMIGRGVTGFYPHLNKGRRLLDEKIREYIEALRA